MLQLQGHEQMGGLADQLAAVLAAPVADPMAAEWIVVGSAGVDRWLRLQLSQRLGCSVDPSSTDGVAANLDLLYPQRLVQRILAPRDPNEPDPWGVDQLTWVVLEVLAGLGSDARLGPIAQLAPGATRWSRARRLADLFDRYLLHRPHMVRSWGAGDDVDGLGNPLPERARWQPYLWRSVREQVGMPSPAELMPDQLAALRAGQCPDDVPERVSLFGLTTIPGGAPFLELLDALATQRDVHLLLHHPSAALADKVRRPPGVVGGLHPLLRSWARPARDTLVLLGDRGADEPIGPAPTPRSAVTTVLQQVQADLRADQKPAGQLVPSADDRSLRIHSCHGASRQVEVLRDQILHLLADDDHLREDDVVVLCPSLEEFVPLIEAAWGPSASSSPVADDNSGSPALAYRMTDRSLGSIVPVLAALASLLELLDSRFSDAAVLDFANLAPVRERYDLDDEDLSRLADWVEQANVRWGLDAAHRQRWGLPAGHADGAWSTALDRLLLGVMVSDDPLALGPGEVLPIGVEGSGVALAGRFAELLDRLKLLADEAQRPRPVGEWIDLLRDASDQLFATERGGEWQAAKLANLFEDIAQQAAIGGQPSAVDLTLAEVRALIGRRLQDTAGRAEFFRGGITVTSLTPLRGLPHRVVCLLGVDESAFTSGAPDGDDLTSLAPEIGDRDRRAETRQALLDAVLAAEDHLIITRTGHSVVTNQPVPPAVAVAELREAVAATIADGKRQEAMAAIEIAHPRQGYDERNFRPGAIDPGATVAWGFNTLARDGADRRRMNLSPPAFLEEPLAVDPLPVVDLGELRDFLENPVRYFVRSCLRVNLPEVPSRSGGKLVAPSSTSSGLARASEGRNLVLELDSLESWKVADRLLAHRRSGGDVGSFRRRERASDLLPPGRLSDRAIDLTVEKVDPLVDCLDDLGVLGTEPIQRPVDVSLPDGTRLVGSVRDDRGVAPGPVTVTASHWHRKRELGPWLDLLALTAQDPSRPWTAQLVASAKSKARVKSVAITLPGESATQRRDRALTALSTVVGLFQRGRTEPLPIFPETSIDLYEGKPRAATWSGYQGMGEGVDRWVQLVFGSITFAELLAIECRPDDPPGGNGGRAERYASVLWGAFHDSQAAPDDDGADL
ncbi:MAG: exonuclease V subunit gamma [Acidimicrobiia bacterium]|nr:exonuclease V subunit gamma [Acidimicrobiia bacterium]